MLKKFMTRKNTKASKRKEFLSGLRFETLERRELLAGDLGCLMNMAGKLKREGSPVEVRHVAEVLAGMTDTPPIAGKG